MRTATLIVVTDDEIPPDPHASEAAARRALPGVRIERVITLDEPDIGGWLAAHRGRRCRTAQDVLRTPERQQPVVIDADLPASAW